MHILTGTAYSLYRVDILLFLGHIFADCKTMDQSAGRLRPRTDDRMEQRMEHFLNSFRATTEKFITDLGNLLSETTLAFKDSFENVDTNLTDGMNKIAETLSQIHEQFKESTTNRNQIEANERADAIKQKNYILLERSFIEKKRPLLETLQQPKGSLRKKLYEIYLEKNFVPRKFRTKLPNSYTEKEKELLGNLAIDKVKHEIIILKNRSSEFKEQ